MLKVLRCLSVTCAGTKPWPFASLLAPSGPHPCPTPPKTDRQRRIVLPRWTAGARSEPGRSEPEGPVSLGPGGCRLPVSVDPGVRTLLSALPEEAARSFRRLVLTSAWAASAVISWVSLRGVG